MRTKETATNTTVRFLPHLFSTSSLSLSSLIQEATRQRTRDSAVPSKTTTVTRGGNDEETEHLSNAGKTGI